MPVQAVERDGKVRIVEKDGKKVAKFKTGRPVDGGGYPTTAAGWKAAAKKTAAINHSV
uniref:Uncharacterized protein n=1 Tax=viral metagenome TaxID=1070528 RepID=A0A6M3IZN3_9ZZZZ